MHLEDTVQGIKILHSSGVVIKKHRVWCLDKIKQVSKKEESMLKNPQKKHLCLWDTAQG